MTTVVMVTSTSAGHKTEACVLVLAWRVLCHPLSAQITFAFLTATQLSLRRRVGFRGGFSVNLTGALSRLQQGLPTAETGQGQA